MKSITEKEYIAATKSILDTIKNPVEAIWKIAEIQCPEDTPANVVPFIADFPKALKWNGENTYEYYLEDEFKEAQLKDAREMLQKVNEYIRDYDTGNWYVNKYVVLAVYEGLYELNPAKADLAPDNSFDTKEEAAKLAERLKQDLPERFFVIEADNNVAAAGNYRLETVGVVAELYDNSGKLKGKKYFATHSVDWTAAS